MIESVRVRVPAEAAGEFSSPVLTFSADSHSVSVPARVTAVARKRPRPFRQKCSRQGTLKHAYALDRTESEWADYAVQAQCRNQAGKRAHTQLVREHSATVVSVR